MNPTGRFSERAQWYRRYRPGYPPALLDLLRREAGLTAESVVADIGAGTGISTGLLLPVAKVVYAVEPNAEMRAIAEEELGGQPGFRSVAGTAEATTLTDQSVDLVTVGTALHWFQREQTRREFQRILRPPGWVALFWNTRRRGTPLNEGYEDLLLRYGLDYQPEWNRAATAAEPFLGAGAQRFELANQQIFDWPAFLGRALSASYVPMQGHKNHAPFVDRLEALFARVQNGGVVEMDYVTEVYLGQLA
jgi:SAM-dependent methyltransferase